MATTKKSILKKRLVLRIPEEFHKLIQIEAQKERRSVNNYVEMLLSLALKDKIQE